DSRALRHAGRPGAARWLALRSPVDPDERGGGSGDGSLRRRDLLPPAVGAAPYRQGCGHLIGSFQAQHFRFLSFDPNTIFQFFVASDRLYLVKIGSALNQLPQVLHLATGPIGLSDLAADGLPSDHEVQRLVRADPANCEITLGELTGSSLSSKHWLSAHGALTLQSSTRGKLFFRFLD